MKTTYSIFEAKARLSEIVRTVRNKHEVIITDRSEPVVRVVPIKKGKPAKLVDRLEALERMGQISNRKTLRIFPRQEDAKPGLLDRFLRERD